MFEIDPVRIGIAGSRGAPIPAPILAKMEAAFRADFSGVRVHQGPQADRIGAVAFTMGNDIFFAPGRFQPDSIHGQQLLGHELAHVIQQRQGRVANPSSGVSVVQNHALEAEADRLGALAAAYRGPINSGHSASRLPTAAASAIVQRKTFIRYDVARHLTGLEPVHSIEHTRTMHGETHRNIVAYLSGYDGFAEAGADRCGVCSHHISYSLISKAVLQKNRQLP